MRLDATNDKTKVHDWINQVYAEACIDVEANVTSATMALTAGSASYTLPSTVSRIKGMYITPSGGAQSQPLIATTLDYILRRRQASGGTATATGYVTHYTLLGISDFEVYPTPQSADTITVWAVELPTPLSADADVPIFPEPYASKILEYGALAEAADWKGDPSEPEYRQLFEQWKQKFRSHLTRKGSSQPGQFRIFPGYAFPPHDPSTDNGWT